MRKLLSAIIAASALASSAFAGPCVVLEYQEMKDMSAEQLAKENCKLWDALSTNVDENMSNLKAGDGPKPFPTAHDNFEQCHGQIDRVERILASKGMDHDAAMKVCNAVDAEKKSKK